MKIKRSLLETIVREVLKESVPDFASRVDAAGGRIKRERVGDKELDVDREGPSITSGAGTGRMQRVVLSWQEWDKLSEIINSMRQEVGEG